MFIINNAEGRNPRHFISKNGREDIKVDDLDLGGGTTPVPPVPTVVPPVKTESEIEAERVAKEKLENPDSTSLDLIKDVEHETVKGFTEDNINAVLEKHNAVGFDKEGNLIDTTGKVLKTYDEYKDDIAPTEDEDPLKGMTSVTIEEKDYKLDENGNAVDESGAVIKTKEEIVALLAEDEDADADNNILAISSITGFAAVDDKGEPVEFEDTIEGHAARETHIVRQEASKLADSQIEAFFDKNPDLVEMYNHKRLHGSLQDFATREKYDDIVVEDANDDQHKSLIVKAEISKGNTEVRAKAVADLFVGDGKGKIEADASLQYLKDKQKTEDTDAEKALTDKNAIELEVSEKYMTEVSMVVKSGKANGYTIPEYFTAKLGDGRTKKIHRNGLFQMITQPTDGGSTQYDLMRQSDTVEQKVLDAYLRLTGYDIDSLVKQRAATERIKLIKHSKERTGTKITLHKVRDGVNFEDLDL